MRNIAYTVVFLLVLFIGVELAAEDQNKPAVKSGSTADSLSGSFVSLSGGSSSSPAAADANGPGLIADIVGVGANMHYCIVGEPCGIVRQFRNAGAAGSAPIPSPTWSVNNTPATPISVQHHGHTSPGWPAGETRKWLARFTLGPGEHVVRAVIPRLANEKEDKNNSASGKVVVGRPDMSIKLERENVDYNTRYEIKAEVQNKGNVPTRALSVLVVLSVNTHTGTPPSLDACMMNQNLDGCVIERHTVDSLEPGEKKRWKIGPKQLASTNVAARGQVACSNPSPCTDSNPDNNTTTKRFGP